MDEFTDSLRRFKSGIGRAKTDFFLRQCFHQDPNCTSIIGAHSIQNNRILNRISKQGLVTQICVEPSEESPIIVKPLEIGRKTASVFTGFCGYHDKAIFDPIESKDYCPGNAQQEFLFAYRALAKEYHIKASVVNMHSSLLEMAEGGDVSGIQKYFDYSERKIPKLRTVFSSYLLGANRSMKDLEDYRTAMNINLDSARFSKIETFTITLSAETPVACSSMFYILRDFGGRIVNDLGDLNSYVRPTFLTVFPQGGYTMVLFGFFKKHRDFFIWLKNELDRSSNKERGAIISNILATYVENLFMSPDLWDSLPGKVRESFLAIYDQTIVGVHPRLMVDENLNLFCRSA